MYSLEPFCVCSSFNLFGSKVRHQHRILPIVAALLHGSATVQIVIEDDLVVCVHNVDDGHDAQCGRLAIVLGVRDAGERHHDGTDKKRQQCLEMGLEAESERRIA